MKRIIATALAALMLLSAAACGRVSPDTSATATASAPEQFLIDRLGSTEGLILGTAADAAAYGIDMTDFRSEGYVIRSEGAETLILGKTEDGLDRGVRYYANNCADGGVLNVTYGEGYRVKRITIAGRDISEYSIVYDDASDYNGRVNKGATELQKYIREACGATLPVYAATNVEAMGMDLPHTITLTVDYPDHGNEAFTIEVTEEGDIEILGGRVTGCLYGAYGLLEDMGWRFLADAVSYYDSKNLGCIDYVYEAEQVDITSEINRTETPVFDSRRMDDAGSGHYVGHKAHISANWYSGHGLNQVDYTGTSFEGYEHKGYQPCLTDEEILERIDEHVVTVVENYIKSGKVIGRDLFGVSLGQYDNAPGACMCTNCMAVIGEEKSKAGLYVRLANRAAQTLIDNGYEGLHINILAYSDGTDIPPQKTMPSEHVRIAFCFYISGGVCCNLHPIDGSKCDPTLDSSNCRFAERFEAWYEICPPGNLDVWYYPFHAGNAIVQAPMVTNLYDDIKYLADHGVKAIINTVISDISSALPMQALVAYLLNEICWQFPESREEFDAMIREWFFITYGEGWEYLYEYFCEYEKLGQAAPACTTAFHFTCLPDTYVENNMLKKKLDYFLYLFDRARDKATTTRQAELIDRFEAGLLYLGTALNYEEWYVNGTEEERKRLLEMYGELHRILAKYNLHIYKNLNSEWFHVPAEMDPDVDPGQWFIWDHEIMMPRAASLYKNNTYEE